jgi:NADH:ubiquinone oxidoreductase subunit 3 (subunit A)
VSVVKKLKSCFKSFFKKKGSNSDSTLFLLPAIFGVALVAALVIYWLGGRISPKNAVQTVGKTAPYACGEDMPAEEMKVDLERFLVFAVYFLIFDVFAFLVVTSFYTGGFVPVFYSLIVLISVAMLILSGRHR